MIRSVLVVSIATLSACGSTTNPPTSGGLPAVTTNLGSTVMGGSVDPALADGTAVVISIDGAAIAGMQRDSRFDRGPFSAAVSFLGGIGGGGASSAAYSASSGPNGMSVSFVRNSNSDVAARYSRNSSTNLPVSGAATFNGTYMGNVNQATNGNANSTLALVTGDVALTADFDQTTIYGRISNRSHLGEFSGSVTQTVSSDVILGVAPIDPVNGTFSGFATGGEYTAGWIAPLPAHLTTTGSYQGMIGGINGTEAAGAVNLSSTYSGGIRTQETGVFIAN